MKTRIIVSFLILLLVLCPAQAATTEPITLTLASDYQVFTPALPLSHYDMLWLAAKKTLTVAVYSIEEPPLSLNSAADRYRGMNADYLLLLEDSLKIKVVIKHYVDRAHAFAALTAGNVDLVLTPLASDETLTEPFVASLSLVRAYPTLVTRQADLMKPLSNEHDEVRVAIKQGYPSEQFIKMIFPRAEITSYTDNYLAMFSVFTKDNDY